MIISASRRTDIPAFFPQWFSKCLSVGYAEVANPFNPLQIRKVSLLPHEVDGFVFWTKFPLPFFSCLDSLDQRGFDYYFQYTLTPYPAEIEPGVPGKQTVTKVFKSLADRLGPSRIIWRYDPILLTPVFTPGYHLRAFENLCRNLEGQTRQVIVSFFHPYRKCQKKTRHLGIYDPDPQAKEVLLQHLYALAGSFGIELTVCADPSDYKEIRRAKCIDNALFRAPEGRIPYVRSTHQREFCQCHDSVDIGSYATCGFGCIYCYAS